MAVSSIPSLVKRRKNRRLFCQWTSGELHGVNLKKATGGGWLLFWKKLYSSHWNDVDIYFCDSPDLAMLCVHVLRVPCSRSFVTDLFAGFHQKVHECILHIVCKQKNSFPTIFTDSLLFGQSHWTPRHLHILGGAMLISIVSKNGKMKYLKPPMHKSTWVFSLCQNPYSYVCCFEGVLTPSFLCIGLISSILGKVVFCRVVRLKHVLFKLAGYWLKPKKRVLVRRFSGYEDVMQWSDFTLPKTNMVHRLMNTSQGGRVTLKLPQKTSRSRSKEMQQIQGSQQIIPYQVTFQDDFPFP